MLQVKDDESDRYFNSCIFETWRIPGLFAKQSCFRNRIRSILIATWLWKCLKLHFCTATQFLLLFNWNYLLLRDGIYLNTSCTKRIPARLCLLLARKIGPEKHRVGEVWRAIEKTNSVKQNKSPQFTGNAQLARISPFSAALTIVSEHITNGGFGWHFEGESPELRQVIFSVITVSKVIENHSSCPAFYSSLRCSCYHQMQRWRIYSCLTVLSLLPHQGRRWAIQ